jgi:predicted helicase
MKANWGPVSAKLSSNNIVAERFVQAALVKFADHTVANDISSFFKDKDTGAYARGLIIVNDNILTNARYKERDEKLVLEWLETHEYV